MILKGENSLPEILSKHNIRKDFDFLSIDVDGTDYYIWESLEKKYNPKVVCIEFNPTIPNNIEFIQTASHKIQQG